VQRLLESLKALIAAKVTGVLDGARGQLYASSEASADAFWEAFYNTACLPDDWGEWDLVLLASTYARLDCLCGGHRVEAFTVHERWILVVLTPSPLAPGAQERIDRARKMLERLLPRDGVARAVPGGGPAGGGGGQGPAELGIPAWWIRNRAPN